MADNVLDWTFAEIPLEEAPEGAAMVEFKLNTPPRAAHAFTFPKLRAPRWLPWAALGLLVLAAAGLALQRASQAGWGRLQQQVTEAVRYEDAQARAGQVQAVIAAQVHTDGGWLAERKLEAAVSLPAPSPAPELHLLPGAPEVIAFSAPYVDQVQATVLRRYADDAGQVFQFETTQTYVSAEAGIWLRQPTESADLHTSTLWDGPRLSASFPLADESWMNANLPLVESDLESACAACPASLYVKLAFTTTLPLPASPAGQLILLSPHVAGWAHDAAASQALRQAITTQARRLLDQ
jgi:hypothetical protein